MWPFGSKQQKLNPGEVQTIRKACKATITANQACSKIHGEASSACERLENRVVECLADRCRQCQQQVEAFRACLQTIETTTGSITGNECSKPVQDMRRCLSKLGIPI